MGRGWRITGIIAAALWAFFLVAMTVTPRDVWEHLVAWWGVIVIGAGFAAAGLAWASLHLFGPASFIHALYVYLKQRKR